MEYDKSVVKQHIWLYEVHQDWYVYLLCIAWLFSVYGKKEKQMMLLTCCCYCSLAIWISTASKFTDEPVIANCPLWWYQKNWLLKKSDLTWNRHLAKYVSLLIGAQLRNLCQPTDPGEQNQRVYSSCPLIKRSKTLLLHGSDNSVHH